MKLFNKGDGETLGEAYWRVQPRWLKRLVYIILVPAWLVLMYGVLVGGISGTTRDVAFASFASVGVLELAFIARGFWRDEI